MNHLMWIPISLLIVFVMIPFGPFIIALPFIPIMMVVMFVLFIIQQIGKLFGKKWDWYDRIPTDGDGEMFMWGAFDY